MTKKQKSITSLEELKEIILKAKDEKTAFDEIHGVLVSVELNAWFAEHYAYDDNKTDPKYKRYKRPQEEAFSNLYFDVINELV